MRTNNELEFTHDDMRTYYFDHEMEHQTSCTYTPQRIFESNHRHLLEVARALYFQVNLPISFLSECVLTTTYLINRMPLFALQDKTLYEILLKKRLIYDHLRSFQCLYYGHVNDKGRDKFASRFKPGVFVGYPNRQKGYKIYYLKSKRICVSWDI